ncbi:MULTISPECIES: LacI family DNA-binding transcriptional regulator [unclassified Streptomyces]|uniref:LacI family DNA-binding transcriptional regulator n=1 Tax=unclassified Streptomyces TaxID=2593676 RepID=UPI000B85289C|nr:MULTISPECIES: LacI family DNA-binding transcriptional regulator [unclassified Streptomyces]MYS22101.1 substrate-binding domain-containing protein [Streptomyces sp. SID4948]
MKQVATIAGVSAMTVSRVLRGDTGVSADKRARVEAAVRQLGYRPNTLARNFRHGQGTGTIGLIVTNLANPFYARLALGIEAAVAEEGLRVMITNTAGDAARERDAVADFSARRVDGLILVPAGADQAYLAEELPAGLPVVMVARPPAGYEADCVLVDDFGGAYAATSRLLAAGHRRIGFLGNPPSVYTGSERYRGYCAALENAGVHPDDELVKRGQEDLASAERAASELLALPHPPTAVFCTNNRNTLGAYRALRHHELRATLAGFDDFDLADVLSVPVLVVDYDPDEIGRRAAHLLGERLARPATGTLPPRRVVVRTSIITHGADRGPTPV